MFSHHRAAVDFLQVSTKLQSEQFSVSDFSCGHSSFGRLALMRSLISMSAATTTPNAMNAISAHISFLEVLDAVFLDNEVVDNELLTFGSVLTHVVS